jgi:MFS family permease
VAIVAALTGLLLGLDTAAISGALSLIQQEMHVNNPFALGLVVSIMLFGALLGAILGGSTSR